MAECGCIYVENDGDLADVIEQNTRKARKLHLCSECGREIQIGEEYEYFKGKSDGELFVNKTCLDCLSIRRNMFCKRWNFGGIKDDLWNHISDFDGKIDEDCLLQLTPMARGTVADMIDQYWETQDSDGDGYED